ncbi:MAG: alpha/beta fold hydrolase [bacterium]
MEDSGPRQEPVEENTLYKMNVLASRVVFRDTGAGEPVVLVHGWGGSGYDWKRLIPYFDDQYRVIVPDLPGFGNSDKPDIAYNLDYYLRFMEAFIAELGVSRFHLAGHSMGGQIAAAYALHHPAQVASLVLLDPAGVSHQVPWFYRAASRPWIVYPLLRFMPLFLFEFWQRRFGPYYDSSFLSHEDIKGHYHSYGHKPGARAATRTFKNIVADPAAWLDNRIAEIKAPALVVWGRQDPLLPLEMSEAFIKCLPGARLEVLERCGHCPQEEKPEELADLCTSHFRDARLSSG